MTARPTSRTAQTDAARADAALAAARQAMAARRWSEAARHLETALKARPKDAGLLRALAQARFAEGKPQPALQALDAALRQRPRDSALHYDRAQLLRSLGRRPAAVEAARRAAETAPQAPEPALLLAELLVEEKRPAEAVELLAPLAAARPQDGQVALAQGAALLAAGLPDEALAPLGRAAGLPGAAGAFALHNRATCLGDLGQIAESAAAAEAALARLPGLPGPLWHLGLCALDAGDLPAAAERFAAARRANPEMGLAAAYHAAVLALLGEDAEAAWRTAERLDPAQAALREAVALYRETATAQDGAPALFGFKPSLLRHALAAAPTPEAMPDGLACEFGVFTGRSLRLLAETRPGPWHGFDSFEGLPEGWLPDEGAGAYSTRGRLPELRAGVELHVGWFADTLPGFLAARPGAPLAFANIDCDIYSSTAQVLEALADRLRPGSVLVFDEYFAYPGWRDHEAKAFAELVAARTLAVRTLALSPFTRQAAMRIEGGGPNG
jgi:tetratricopeptide (TPR) repeat protein